MAKISINHKCNLPANDAFSKIKTFFETDTYIRRLDSKMKCSFVDDKMTGKATGGQFKADIAVTGQDSGSMVNIVIDLSLLLTPLKGKVQETIERNLNKYLS